MSVVVQWYGLAQRAAYVTFTDSTVVLWIQNGLEMFAGLEVVVYIYGELAVVLFHIHFVRSLQWQCLLVIDTQIIEHKVNKRH